MLEFIVLGLVPGTNISITFYTFLTAILAFVASSIALGKTKSIKHKLTQEKIKQQAI